jgi:rod shape-determining protein MreD
MSIPLAAVGAVVVALLEVSVFPELTIAGIKPDLIFVFAITATTMIGIEVGLTWAFVGGLMLDLLTPGRQLGATSLVLLLLAGAIILVSRYLPQRRVLVAAAAVFVLACAFQVLEGAILGATTGLDPMISATLTSLTSILSIALVDAALALPIAAVMRLAWLRYGATERTEW